MTFLLKSGGFYSNNPMEGTDGPNSNHNAESQNPLKLGTTPADAEPDSSGIVSNSNAEMKDPPKNTKCLKSQDIHLKSTSLVIKTEKRLTSPDKNDTDNFLQIDSVQSLNPASVSAASLSESSNHSNQNSFAGENEEKDNNIENSNNSWSHKSDTDSRDSTQILAKSSDDSINEEQGKSSRFSFSSNGKEKENKSAYKSKARLPFTSVKMSKLLPSARKIAESISRKIPPKNSLRSTTIDNSSTSESEIVRKFDPVVGHYYGCPKCQNKFVTADCVKEHLTSCMSSGDRSQQRSGSSSTSNSNQGDTSEAKYFCSICSRSFYWKASFYRHMENVHKTDARSSSSIIDVDDDEDDNDEDDPPVKRQLRDRTDFSKKNFNCGLGICPRTFENTVDLYEHRRSCHANKLTKGRGVPSPKKVDPKSDRSSGTGSYKCDFCDQSFFLKSYLEEHEKTHVIEYPYSCEICAEYFSSTADLKDHTDQHHPTDQGSIGSVNTASSVNSNETSSRLRNRRRPRAEGRKSGNVTAYVEID